MKWVINAISHYPPKDDEALIPTTGDKIEVTSKKAAVTWIDGILSDREATEFIINVRKQR